MSSENLLKSISATLKKHEDFLNNNPEMFKAIEYRLFKAIDDEYEDEGYDDEGFGDEQFSDMFDEEADDSYSNEPKEFQDIEEDDAASKYLREAEAAYARGEEHPEEEATPEEEVTAPKEKSEVSASGFKDWSPKDSYKQHHQAQMDKLMEEGFSHREAERKVGQQDRLDDPLKNKTKPSEPSEKFHESTHHLTKKWLVNLERTIQDNADENKQPVLAANSKNRKAHNETHGDFDAAFKEFKSSDDFKKLKHRARGQALKAFRDKWHEENPEHKENSITAAGTNAGSFDNAKSARSNYLDESRQSGRQLGTVNEATTLSEFAAKQYGGEVSGSAAAQAVGGTQTGDGGYVSSTDEHPMATLARTMPEGFKRWTAEQDKKAKLAETKTKFNESMNHPDHAERKERLTAQQGLKEGDE